jgi:hypothetical protein
MAEQQNDQKSTQQADKKAQGKQPDKSQKKPDQSNKSFVVGGSSDPTGSDTKGNSLGLGTITNTSIGGQPDVASKSREERKGDGGTGEFAIKVDDAPEPGPGVSASGSSLGAGQHSDAPTTQGNTTNAANQSANLQDGPRVSSVGSGSTVGSGPEITDLNSGDYANPATGSRSDQDKDKQQ